MIFTKEYRKGVSFGAPFLFSRSKNTYLYRKRKRSINFWRLGCLTTARSPKLASDNSSMVEHRIFSGDAGSKPVPFLILTVGIGRFNS